ncbi:MAG: hydrogenase maturation nickel metallochaperone HypA/HybF, partial [Candidatus Ranarchaeia archaeon]
KVVVQLGELTTFEKDQIEFNYSIVIEGDPLMKDSKIDVRLVRAKVRCSKCRYEGPIKKIEDKLYQLFLPTLSCPRCGGRVEVLEGRDFIIQSIDMEVP